MARFPSISREAAAGLACRSQRHPRQRETVGLPFVPGANRRVPQSPQCDRILPHINYLIGNGHDRYVRFKFHLFVARRRDFEIFDYPISDALLQKYPGNALIHIVVCLPTPKASKAHPILPPSVTDLRRKVFVSPCSFLKVASLAAAQVVARHSQILRRSPTVHEQVRRATRHRDVTIRRRPEKWSGISPLGVAPCRGRDAATFHDDHTGLRS
jgi:hypothetical protein